MQSAPLPADEPERLQALYGLQVLDSGAEEEFDAMVRVASLVCKAPISLISLVDAERQWFKANIGLPGVSETPRDIAFCAHAILSPEVFEVEDASQDPRFSDNPLVASQPDIRFYAGAPVVLDSGRRVGTLCVIDRVPHKLDAVQRSVLQSLATAAAKALEGRRAMRELQNVDRQLHQEQKVLRETQERMRLATESGGVGIWDMDVERNELRWDSQMYRLFGYAPQTGVGTYELWSRHLHPDDHAEAEAAFARSLASGVPFDHAFRVVWPDGSVHHLRGFGRVHRNAQGKPQRVLGANWDVTDFALQAQQLRQARDEAEQASRSKGQFLANMSHEIRTPMNAILGMLELLQNTELTARQQDYTNKSEEAARSLLGLLNDILDFSKVEAGKMVLENEPFALDKLMRGLAVVLGANVGRKNVEVLFDVDPALPAQVVGDSMRLHQVLVNLGGNAVKFTTQGQVIVALQQVSRSDTQVGIEFSVQDTGIGIAPEHQQQIFSGFTQAEASTTRRFGGTGLGLAICKRLVELMGGDITLTSTVGQGSTFAFTVQFAIAADDTVVQSAPPDGQARRHALVVDDNPIAAHLLRRMVESLGWECTVAASGQEALEWLRQRALPLPTLHRPDVIYLDWQMEGMDGWEAAKRMHALYAEAGQELPPVIMVTAHGRQTLAQRSQAEQDLLRGFLVKPLTGPMLRDAYEGALKGVTGLRKSTRGQSTQRVLGGMRILVVEDNLINQQVAEELLSSRGAWVSLAANGQAGVDAVAAAAPQFDAVLMDIQMPVMDGYAATRVIRENLGLGQLPIIAMTANAMAGDREACLEAGMNEHVGKPFDIEQLASLLVRVTGFQTTQTGAAPLPVERIIARQHLPQVPGLDLPQALERMSGMTALYIRTARDFIQTLALGVAPLQAALDSADATAAVRAFHTLKGNAGTLGATALAAEAGRLEYLLRALQGNTRIDISIDKLAELMASARQALEQAVAALEAQAAAPIALATPVTPDLAWLQGLADRIAESDFEVLELLAQGRDQLATFPAEFVADFEEALQGLDFDKAALLCQAQLGAKN